MRMRVFTTTLALLIGLGTAALTHAAPLAVGDKAPNFDLPDQNGNHIKLSDLVGKKNVVLAFYVFAFTGG
jgi:peroxiredoxin